MGGRAATLGVLAQMAFRNLFASRLKTVIVGGIVFFGALLVTVGSSLVDSVTNAMSRSIIGSVAGHMQVYSSRSRDELELFGGGMADPNLAQVDDFAALKRTVMSVPNVKEVVPMGLAGAIVASGNTIDQVLTRLRDAVRQKLQGDSSPDVLARIDDERAHVRQIVSVLEGDIKNLSAIRDDSAASRDETAAVATAASDDFWAGFDRDPLTALEFLENKLAPLATDSDMLFLRYVGTDMAAFTRSFDRLKIVDGQAIPEGRRGFMFAKFFAEERLKLKTARRLDKIKEAIETKGFKIATDVDLQRMVRENTNQTREIVLQLDQRKTKLALDRVLAELGGAPAGVKADDLGALLAKALDTNDENFARRYKFFYAKLAPMLELYRIRVGDTLTIKAFTKTGYTQSVNLRVWGTFEMEGLEKSFLAGSFNLMDMVSFRELYGFQTADKTAEILKLKNTAGFKDVTRENAEAELFGTAGNSAADAPAEPPTTIPDLGIDGIGKIVRQDRVDQTYPRSELEGGVVLSAAVILKDPSQLAASMRDVQAAVDKANLSLKVISWQAASGLLGKLVMTFQAILLAAVLIIFVVALVIINNALVMATLERVQEIGTLRAVGAQRSFIAGMLLIEALAVGVIFGAMGTGVGAAIIAVLGKVGIPATSDVLYLFFSGPRLYPFLATTKLAAAFVVVLMLSGISSFYPAWLAMRVTPRQAMAADE